MRKIKDDMQVRAIKDLNQLSEEAFLKEVSQGLNYILQNADRIINAASALLEQNHYQAAWILRGVAEEEAAKFLILMDAVRCPRKSQYFSHHLSKFYDHLARGIYAEYYSWRPATFSEAAKAIERMRDETYLDGPEGVEWIFRNRILQEREGAIYVDYIKNDNGHEWLIPKQDRLWKVEIENGAIEISRALKALGCTTREALAVISAKWDTVEITDSFYCQDLRKINSEILNVMKDRDYLADQADATYRKVVNYWLFPLYSLELRVKKVWREALFDTP